MITFRPNKIEDWLNIHVGDRFSDTYTGYISYINYNEGWFNISNEGGYKFTFEFHSKGEHVIVRDKPRSFKRILTDSFS